MTRVTERAARVALALLAVVLPIGVARGATSARPWTLEPLVERSDEIVLATVAATESRWEGRVIVTVARLAVSEAFKGSVPSEVEITQLGGSAIHPRTGIAMTMTASTQVDLRPGQEVVAFVARGADGRRQLVGGSAGLLAVRSNPRTGAKELPVGPRQLAVEGVPGRPELRTAVLTLDALRVRIQEALRDPGGHR